jgi:hypothetical protein
MPFAKPVTVMAVMAGGHVKDKRLEELGLLYNGSYKQNFLDRYRQ